jgi:hypothetical protein
MSNKVAKTDRPFGTTWNKEGKNVIIIELNIMLDALVGIENAINNIISSSPKQTNANVQKTFDEQVATYRMYDRRLGSGLVRTSERFFNMAYDESIADMDIADEITDGAF